MIGLHGCTLMLHGGGACDGRWHHGHACNQMHGCISTQQIKGINPSRKSGTWGRPGTEQLGLWSYLATIYGVLSSHLLGARGNKPGAAGIAHEGPSTLAGRHSMLVAHMNTMCLVCPHATVCKHGMIMHAWSAHAWDVRNRCGCMGAWTWDLHQRKWSNAGTVLQVNLDML